MTLFLNRSLCRASKRGLFFSVTSAGVEVESAPGNVGIGCDAIRGEKGKNTSETSIWLPARCVHD